MTIAVDALEETEITIKVAETDLTEMTDKEAETEEMEVIDIIINHLVGIDLIEEVISLRETIDMVAVDPEIEDRADNQTQCKEAKITDQAGTEIAEETILMPTYGELLKAPNILITA